MNVYFKIHKQFITPDKTFKCNIQHMYKNTKTTRYFLHLMISHFLGILRTKKKLNMKFLSLEMSAKKILIKIEGSQFEEMKMLKSFWFLPNDKTNKM